jgi:hypothetical protein
MPPAGASEAHQEVTSCSSQLRLSVRSSPALRLCSEAAVIAGLGFFQRLFASVAIVAPCPFFQLFRANAADDPKVISYPTEKGEEKNMNTKQMVSVAAVLIRLGGDQVMRRSILSAGAVVLAIVAGAADASTVVYNSTWVYAAGTEYPGPEGGIVRHPTLAYWARQATEHGGKVELAGSDRLAQSATVQMRSGGGGIDGTVTMSLNFYSLISGSVGNLLGSKTQTFFIPGGDPDAGPAIPPNPADSANFWVTRPWFEVTFDLSALNLTLPNQLAWGLEFDANQNEMANSLNINMWNYGTVTNWTEPRLVDGSQVKTGTDLGGTWGRRYDGGAGYTGTLQTQESIYTNTQFTPSIAITAVPEPSTYCMALAGLACGGYLVRRCRRRA